MAKSPRKLMPPDPVEEMIVDYFDSLEYAFSNDDPDLHRQICDEIDKDIAQCFVDLETIKPQSPTHARPNPVRDFIYDELNQPVVPGFAFGAVFDQDGSIRGFRRSKKHTK